MWCIMTGLIKVSIDCIIYICVMYICVCIDISCVFLFERRAKDFTKKKIMASRLTVLASTEIDMPTSDSCAWFCYEHAGFTIAIAGYTTVLESKYTASSSSTIIHHPLSIIIIIIIISSSSSSIIIIPTHLSCWTSITETPGFLGSSAAWNLYRNGAPPHEKFPLGPWKP